MVRCRKTRVKGRFLICAVPLTAFLATYCVFDPSLLDARYTNDPTMMDQREL
jgi:hypothetical protein